MKEATEHARSRTVWLWLGLLIGVPAFLLSGLVICAQQIERQRIQDASPAFDPLLKLHAGMFSNPVPFARYVHYYLEFEDSSELSDENISILESLNQLPDQNELGVWINTRKVTDASLPALLKVRTFDILDVTDSAISNEGIEKLARGLPEANVVRRIQE